MENIRLLLVDDEENFRKLIAERLAVRGIVPEQAGSGEECLSVLEEKIIDVVVLDVKMPGMNGIKTLHQIKRKHPRTEVILLTGYGTTREGVEGIKSGAFDYLSKPVKLEHLLSKIRQAYEKILGEENRLKEAESRYKALLQSVTDYVITLNRDFQIIMANDLFKKEFGIDPDTYSYNLRGKKDERGGDCLPGKSALELFENPEDFSRFQETVSRENYVSEFETRLAGKNGRVFDALISSNVTLDAIRQITGYVVIIKDITERKQAQQQIQMHNLRLAALNFISLVVSSTLDLNEVLNSTIDNMLEIIGPDSVRIYLLDDKREILKLAAHRGLSPDFLEKSQMRCRKVGDGILGETVFRRETRVVDNFIRSGHPYVDIIVDAGFRTSVYVPLVSKGEPVGVMCVCSRSAFRFSEDYVEFLTAVGNQIGMAVHNATLYEKANRALQELKEAQEQVIRSEKLASLGKLSATIAHEINNPLSAVLTYIRLLMKLKDRDLLAPKRMEDISRYLTTMESETARCGEIVKNLLAFSRQSKMTIEEHNIEDIIGKTLMLVSHDLEMKEIRLVKKIEPDLPKVKCDFKQIQQTLLNLVSNASEAMTKGGILTLKASCPQDDGFLEVVISDTGCGIPEKDLKNIFEPFFTTKEEGKGVGLGLSVVYGIITRHNGSIEVESEPGKGSSFKVRLPVFQ